MRVHWSLMLSDSRFQRLRELCSELWRSSERNFRCLPLCYGWCRLRRPIGRPRVRPRMHWLESILRFQEALVGARWRSRCSLSTILLI